MNSCFHCGQPASGRFCCAGCEAVASTILAAGLGSYYETRTVPAERPGTVVEQELRDQPGQNDAALVLERVRCAACLWLIEHALLRVPGVLNADVNYATRRAHVRWDPRLTSLAAIVRVIRSVGYDASPYEPRRQQARERRERRDALWRLFVAGFGAMQGMMYAFPAYVDELTPEASQVMRWAGLAITLPVLLFACRPFFDGALHELRQRRLGLDAPIALGLAFGFVASAWATVTGAGEVYFDSISMLAFLLLGARYLEAAARGRAARELDPLLRAHAQRELAPGERVGIAAGERIPADGVVLEGASSADESLLTGESRPVPKRAGDELVAGAVNLEQPLVMRVTRAGADTRAAAIARLAERGAASKPRLVAAAERVARHLTWIILAVAAAAALHAADPWIAIAVLVVACPCALALAAPIVLTRASGALLARGVLLTRASALEALDRVTDVVLDKTGTLTRGRPSVTRVVPLGALDVDACLELAGSLERASRHPLARAFACRQPLEIEAPRNHPGEGIEARVGGRRVRIGTEPFCQGLCALPPAGPAHPNFDGAHVFLADERGWLAAFELADELRPEAAQAVAALRAQGLEIHLASGDRHEIGETVARALWIEHAAGGMTPEDKMRYVEALQARGRVVAMVGDGLNDVPVLARADVSLAMGGGADATQLRADLVLMRASLEAIPQACLLAHRAMRLIRQNIAWALAYNAIALPLAATGYIGPWEAALAMGASSVTVLLNALRPLGCETPGACSGRSAPSRALRMLSSPGGP